MAHDNFSKKPVAKIYGKSKGNQFAIWPNRSNDGDFQGKLTLQYWNKKLERYEERRVLYPNDWVDLAMISLSAIKWRSTALGTPIPLEIEQFLRTGFESISAEGPGTSPDQAITGALNRNIERVNEVSFSEPEDLDDDDIPF